MTFLYMMQPLVPQIYRFMLLCTMTLLTEFMPYRLSTFNAINSSQCPLSCIVLNERRENVLLISLLHITLSYIQERDSHQSKHPLFLQYRKKLFIILQVHSWFPTHISFIVETQKLSSTI